MQTNEIATKADVEQAKAEILAFLGEMNSRNGAPPKKWLRSAEVREMLGISSSGLQNLRIKGIIPYTKVKGTYYYDSGEIEKVLQSNMKTRA